MTLNDKERQYIRFLLDAINTANNLNDKEATFRRIDNIPRETTIKMLCDLVEYFDLEQAQEAG